MHDVAAAIPNVAPIPDTALQTGPALVASDIPAIVTPVTPDSPPLPSPAEPVAPVTVATVDLPEPASTAPVLPRAPAPIANVPVAAADAQPDLPLPARDVASLPERLAGEPVHKSVTAAVDAPEVRTEVVRESPSQLDHASGAGLLVDRLLTNPTTAEPAGRQSAFIIQPGSDRASSAFQITAAPLRAAPITDAANVAPPGSAETPGESATIVATLMEPAQAAMTTPEPVTIQQPLPAQQMTAESINAADVHQEAGGEWVIQVAAQQEENRARHLLDELYLKHGHRLRGLPAGIERSDQANGTLFRVWAGDFTSQDDARRLCLELKQAGMDCFARRRDPAPAAAAAATLTGGRAAASVLYFSQLQDSASPQPATPSSAMVTGERAAGAALYLSQLQKSASQPAAPSMATTAQVEWTVHITARLKEDAARQELSALLNTHGAVLASLPNGIEPMNLGGEGHGTLYRAWIGAFTREADAVALCRHLTEAGSECFARQRRSAEQAAVRP
jgi:hypothetical protein